MPQRPNKPLEHSIDAYLSSLHPSIPSAYLPSPFHFYSIPSTPSLNSLPAPIINIHFQLPTNNTRHAMTQPNRSEQCIISLLIQEELSTMSQSRIYLSIFINIRSYHPGTTCAVEVKDAAFTYIEEEGNILLASSGSC